METCWLCGFLPMKDIDVLKQTYDMGYRVTKENINRIKELF